jgi:AcrR family transcriptional regulator
MGVLTVARSDVTATRGVRRPYRSPVREQRSADTRRRIAIAAGQLFAEHGFAGTTVARIAQRAGVAAPTVYATFGSKGAIVRALLAQMEQAADSAGWAQRITEQTDAHRKLIAFAQWTTALFSSSKTTIQAAYGATGDPAIVQLRDEGNRHRRHALRAVVSALAQSGGLPAQLSEERAVDRAWMLTGVELYLNATEGCGWTDDEYQEWLATLLQQQLLDR